MEEKRDLRMIEGFPNYRVDFTTGDIISIERIEVRDNGFIKGIHKIKEKILKPTKRPDGYRRIALMKPDGTGRKHFYVHCLVAAHIPNPENKPTVNHKNGIRHDNRGANLEWATRAEQNEHADKVLHAIDHIKKVVDQFTFEGVFVKRWESQADAARGLGLQQAKISACCKGKRNSHGGFIWKFVE
jgi:hypothetical protein